MIVTIQARLFADKYSAVMLGLEDLIFHRLGKDWTERANFSWFLEHLQFAKSIGMVFRGIMQAEAEYTRPQFWNAVLQGTEQQIKYLTRRYLHEASPVPSNPP